MSESTPVWLITATSSGFGKEIALNALKRGHKVIATGRSTNKLTALTEAGAFILKLDVVAPLDELKKVAEEANAKYRRIDILVNAAGYILEGAIEEATPEQTFDNFNTNVFGMLNVTRAVLPYMRKQRSGVIAGFGSLGSWRGGAGGGIYGATKWACSGLMESLRPEIEPFGISATVIEPGYFRSGFLNPGAKISTAIIQDYEDTVVGAQRRLFATVDNKQPGNVGKGAEVIVDVLTKTGCAGGREIPMRLVLGSDCQKVIRGKLASTAELLDEWKDISDSTDYPLWSWEPWDWAAAMQTNSLKMENLPQVPTTSMIRWDYSSEVGRCVRRMDHFYFLGKRHKSQGLQGLLVT
jgi:NADP-dependent 3-hydroxy acid dehydrogenase YdfG